jgi:hypothetical protein
MPEGDAELEDSGLPEDGRWDGMDNAEDDSDDETDQ